MTTDPIRSKRVIVTGGAGVIGRALVGRLLERGAKVLSVDRRPAADHNQHGCVHLVKDLSTCDLDELRDFRPQAIFHLAATFERSKESAEFWHSNWTDNVLPSHRILDMVGEVSQLKAFVFASSYLVYKPSLYLSSLRRRTTIGLNELDPVGPRNLCGAAKYYTENEVEFTKKAVKTSVRFVNARIFRVYGCGSHDVISRWTRAALQGEDIDVYNNQNRFDFVFAGDVAEGLLRLWQSVDAEGVVNLASGRARSIREVLGVLKQNIPNTKSRIRNLGRLEPFETSCADVTRLNQLTGWCPPVDLEQGIRTVVAFERGKMTGAPHE